MVETLDFVLVVSLSLLSLCFIVFLAFFIPILIQVARIFDSVSTILVMTKDSVRKVLNKIDSATEQAGKFTDNIGASLKTLFVGLKAGAESFMKPKKSHVD